MQVTFQHQGGSIRKLVRQEDREAKSEAAWADGYVGLILPTPERAGHGGHDRPPPRGDAPGMGRSSNRQRQNEHGMGSLTFLMRVGAEAARKKKY